MRMTCEFVTVTAVRHDREYILTKRNDTLADRLSRSSEITIGVTGRKSGRTISNPVWFVFEDKKLYLLPVKGSDTQWHKNVLKNPAIRIDAHGAHAEFSSRSRH